ncbi:MAG: sulfotransferase [Bacteroidota bacterium]|nr:sulfotransferase [Bacteroidota bacterium]
MNSKLPNFLIVGAAKCGTSSLHNYLNQHPDIFMPSYNNLGMKVKEPRFLIKDLVKHRLPHGVWSFEEYQSLFMDVKKERLVGESTVLYLYYYEHAIKNIKHYLGKDVKIIIMLRNPIDRAYSAYSFASRTHQENQPFKEALLNSKIRFDNDETSSPMILYKELGLYHKMVKAYMQNFKDVHFIIYDDFIRQTDLEVKRVFDFLNVDQKIHINTNKIINAGGKKWDSKVMKNLLMGEGYVKKFLRVFMPKKTGVFIKEKLTNVFTSKADKLHVSIKKELLDYYKHYMQLLEWLINKDLSQWMKI